MSSLINIRNGLLEANSSANLEQLFLIVETALDSVKKRLQNFANAPNFDSQMQVAFGKAIDVTDLQRAWREGNFSFLPHIELRSSGEINGAIGAFSKQTNKIYLAKEYIQHNKDNLSVITDVLLEEIGHFVDVQINLLDSPGDEGAIFAALVQGNVLIEEQTQHLKTVNDTGSATIYGQIVEIEQAVISGDNGQGGTAKASVTGKDGATNSKALYLTQDATDTPSISFNDITLGNGAFSWTQSGFTLSALASNGGFLANISSGTYAGLWLSQSATASGIYTLTFSQPVNSVEIEFDALSSPGGTPVETISNFTISSSSPTIKYLDQGGTVFDGTTISTRVPDGQGTITITSTSPFTNVSFLHNQNPNQNGFVIERVTIPQQSSSIDPLQVDKTFTFNSATNRYEFTGNIQIGLKGNPFQPLITLQGSMWYNDQIIHAEGTITSNIGSVTVPLFAGNFEINVGQATTKSLNDTSTNLTAQFKLLGLEISFTKIGFVNNQIELQGTVTIPDEMGGGVVEVTGDDKVTISSSGVEITGGSLKLPAESKFVLLDLLEIETQDAELAFNFADKEATLQGKLLIPSFNNAEINLTEDNSIKVREIESGLEFEWKGEISIPELILFEELEELADWKLKDILIEVDSLEETISATAKLLTPQENEISFDLTFEEGKLIQAEATTEEGTDFTWFGTEVDVQQLAFKPDITPDNETPWEPEFEFQGLLKLPEELSGLEVEIKDDDKLILNQKGIELNRAVLKLEGEQKFIALGLLELKTQDVQLEFDFEKKEAKLKGKFLVPIFGSEYELNLTGDQHITFKETEEEIQFAMAAELTVNEVPIFEDWKLTNIQIEVNKSFDQDLEEGEILGTANLITPEGEINLELIFENGHLTQVTGHSAVGKDVTLFGAEIDITRLVGQPDINTSNEDTWEPKLEFQGSIKLPEELSGVTLTMQGDDKLILTEESIELAGTLTLPEETTLNPLGLLEIHAKNTQVEFNSQEESIELQGEFLIPTLKNAVINLTDNNSLKAIQKESGIEVEWIGNFSIQELSLFNTLPSWKLQNINISVNSPQQEISATAKLITAKSSFDLNLEFEGGKLKEFSGTSPRGADFTWLGMDADIRDFTFQTDHNASNENSWEPELEIQGSLKLPEIISGLEIAVQGSDKLILNDEGIHLDGATLRLPGNHEFVALNLLKVKTKNARLDIDSDKQEAKLQGDFLVSLFGRELDLNLAAQRHITVKESNSGLLFAMAADISVTEVPIFGAWKLKDIQINVNKSFGESIGSTSGIAKLITPNSSIDLNVVLQNGQLARFEGSIPGGITFNWLGTQVNLSKLIFIPDINLGNDDLWEPQIEFQEGLITLPNQLSGLQIEVKGNDKFILNESGFDFNGATLKLLGERTFVPFGLLEIKTKDAQLIYNRDNKEAKLQGLFTLPSLNNFQLDLTGTNHITLRDNNGLQLAMAADVAITELPIYSNWKLKDLQIDVKKTFQGDVRAVSKAKLQTNSEVIDLNLTFANGRLDTASAKSGVGDDFTFLGSAFDLRELTFLADINKQNDDSWEPQFEVQGILTLPSLLSSANVAIVNSNKLIVNENGFDLTGGKITLPDFKFNLARRFEVNAEDLTLEYTKNPNKFFKLQGRVSLPTLYNAVADFAGNNYIKVDENGVDAVGFLSAKNIVIVSKVWEIKDAKVTFGAGGDITGQGTILIPTGIEVSAGIGFVNSELNYVRLAANNINKSIATTGLFLQRIGGQVNNIAPSASQPAQFDGELGLTAGARITVSLPSWAGGGFSGSLAELNLNGSLNKERIKADGNLKILGGILQGNGQAELNWNQGFFSAQANFQALGGLISTNSSFRATSNLDITMAGGARVILPNIFPWYLKFLNNRELASADFLVQFSNDKNYGNDFIAGWGSVPILEKAGIQVFLNGDWELLGADEINALPRLARQATRQRVLAAETSTSLEESYSVVAGTPWLLIGANWESGSENVPIKLQAPDGTIYTETDIAASQIIQFIPVPDDPTSKLLRINTPQVGVWTIRLLDAGAVSNVEFAALGGQKVSTLTLSDLTQNANTVTIDYAVESDSNTKISLFYDTDNLGYDGVLISEGLTGTDGTGSYLWNTEGITTGNYYVYAVAVDDNSIPAFSYSQEQIAITDAADLSVTQTTDEIIILDDGNKLTYKVIVTNHGLNTSKGIILNQTLPETVTFVSATLQPSEQAENKLTFNIPDLAPNSSFVVEIEVKIPQPNQVFSFHSYVTSTTFDPNISNNVDILDYSYTPENAVPITEADKTVTLLEDTTSTALNIALPTDADGDTLTITVDAIPDASKGNIRLADATTIVVGNTLSLDQLTGLTFVPLINANGTAGTFRYTVKDGKGGTASQAITLDITAVNDAPFLNQPISAQTASANQAFSFTIPVNTFADVDIGDTLTYTATLENGNPLPTWLTFDTLTGQFNGTPDANDGIFNIKVTASDHQDASVENIFALTINPNSTGQSLIGDNNDNILNGSTGNDTIDGGGGNLDRLLGNAGDDVISDPDGILIASGGTGNDKLDITFTPNWDNDSKPNNSPRSDGKITGGYGNDTILVIMNHSGFFINLKGDEAVTSANSSSNNPLDGDDVITLGGSYGSSVVDLGGGNDTFNGGIENDVVSGRNGHDTIIGGGGNDRLSGGKDNDYLTGNSGADYFLFDTGSIFIADEIGLDTITDLSSTEGDKIVLDKTTFASITSVAQKLPGFSKANEFAIVSDDVSAAISQAMVVYNPSNGSLFYNPNSNELGFGSGGLFASLTNSPTLTANDFFIQA